jgi:hypothetical protein
MIACRAGRPRPRLWAKAALACALAVSSAPVTAQQPPTGTRQINLTAASANVSESGSPVKIRILRWSTDEERSPVVAALNPGLPPEAGRTQPAAGGTGPTPSPAGSPTGASAAVGRRGGAGRGRGGAARGGRGDASVALSPVAALTAAIGRAPTIGYFWTNDITGYSIKYAYHAALPDGGERIILATDRRLGAYTTAWKPVAATPVTDYEFTLFEIRLDSKGLGEGKTSLTTKVILDSEAGTLALDGYAATPAMLRNVKR